MSTLNIKGFPENLYHVLVRRAQENRRSVTSEAIYLLEWALARSHKDRKSILQLKGLGKNLWKTVGTTEHSNKERDSWD